MGTQLGTRSQFMEPEQKQTLLSSFPWSSSLAQHSEGFPGEVADHAMPGTHWWIRRR